MENNIEDYVSVSGGDLDYQNQVKQVLDQIYSTEEGKKIIEQAFDLNDNIRLKIDLSDKNPAAWAHIEEGKIDLPKHNIADMRYTTFLQEKIDFSLTRVMVHELAHMADPERHAFFSDNAERYRQFKRDYDSSHLIFANAHYHEHNDDYREFTAEKAVAYAREQISLDPSLQESLNYAIANNSTHENHAIKIANHFMDKYFNEPPRVNYSETDHEGTPELEIPTGPNL